MNLIISIIAVAFILDQFSDASFSPENIPQLVTIENFEKSGKNVKYEPDWSSLDSVSSFVISRIEKLFLIKKSISSPAAFAKMVRRS
jgi:hypothetical protein